MSWTPFNTGTDILLYDTLLQFWKAARERSWALNFDQFPPRVNLPYYEGTITSMTTTTMTDSSADWVTSPPRWVDYVNEEAPWLPSNYDVVLYTDADDPSSVVKSAILSHTDKVLTISSIQPSITAKWISSAGSLVGKRYAIIRRSGLAWSDFWPTRPNDSLFWNGSTGGVSVTVFNFSGLTPAGSYVGKTFSGSSGTGTIVAQIGSSLYVDWQTTSPSGSFTILNSGTPIATGTVSGGVKDGIYRTEADFPTTLGGKDILVDGRRISITSSTAPAIFFAKQSSSYNASSFVVLASGSRGETGRRKDYPLRWYGGAAKKYYTKYVGNNLFSTDPVGQVETLADSVTFDVPSGLTCEPASHPAKDIPVWSDSDTECPPADACYSPNLYKTIRGLQAWVEQNCIFFIPVKNYQGALAIPPYFPATLFRDINAGYIGTFTGTSNNDGEITFTIPNPENHEYHWSLFDEIGEHTRSDKSTSTSLLITGITANKPYSLVAAKGWTRRVPRTFAHAYPRACFIPDVDNSGITPAVVFPPTDEYPGTWERRTASTNYAEFDDNGIRQETGPSFETNVLARYRGDNWRDPVTDVPVSESDLTAPYWRDIWFGRFEKGTKRDTYKAIKKGNTLYGDRKWFRQTDHDWWGFPIGSGYVALHSGTATSGGSTSLTDTNQLWSPPGGGGPEIKPAWNSSDNGPRFTGMMLEVDKTVNDVLGNPQTVTYRTPITGHTNFTINFTSVGAFTIPASGGVPQINAPSLTVSAGTVYRIKEPRRLNWFEGRSVKITKGVTSETKIITHHDDEVMWFDSNTSFTIDDTCKFEITELNPGYVYKWDGSKWVSASVKEGNRLHPKTITEYGLIRNNDYASITIFQQLAAAFNKLVWTQGSPGWTSREFPETAEQNYGYPTEPIFNLDDDANEATWNSMVAAYNSYFDGITIPYEWDGHAPSYRLFGKLVPTESELGGGNSYAYGVVEPPRKFGLQRAVDFYALAWVDSFNHEQGETTITTVFPGVTTIISNAKTSFVFDPQGGGLMYRAYSKYSSVGATYDARIVSSKLGHSGYVPPIDRPESFRVESTGPGEVTQWRNVKTQGYYIADHKAIIRWNVTGGFTYVGVTPAPLVAFGSVFGDDTPIAMDGTLE